MFQVMERFQLNNYMVAEEAVLDYTVATRRMKAYSFTTKSGRNVPQIIQQGYWAELWGVKIGCVYLWSVTMWHMLPE